MAGTMGTTGCKSNTTVRLNEELVNRMERVRDPERFPTQSDFILPWIGSRFPETDRLP